MTLAHAWPRITMSTGSQVWRRGVPGGGDRPPRIRGETRHMVSDDTTRGQQGSAEAQELTLNDKAHSVIPQIGFGTFQIPPEDTQRAVEEALEIGYRHIDTAAAYYNEKEVGDALKATGMAGKVWVTTKLRNCDQGYDSTMVAFDRSRSNLGVDVVDMYLIHWPLPNPEYKDWKELDIETWRGLEELYKAGKVKAIGVSNFLLHHLENLIQNCEIMPMADQIEFHPGFTQEATVRYCQEKGIYVQAWSPLGRKRVLEHPLLVGLAEKYNKSAAQICLRYEIQRQVIPLPKASTKERMVQNYQVFDFEIEKEDMYRIDSMQPAGWSGEHPDFPRVK